MAHRTPAQKTGDFGEAVAVRLLQKKGYSVIACKYHCRCGEVDIIAADKQYIVFAEVKTRSSTSLARPAAWVDARKQRKILITAMHYLEENQCELQPRFDVIEVVCDKTTGIVVAVEHIENAFGWDG